jgi:hydroxyacylglutathione hydrolase
VAVVVERWTGPPVATHTYLVYDDTSKEAWVVDAPLDTATSVLKRARELDLRLRRLILTHGHFDHILDAGLYAAAGLPVALHPADRPLLEAPQTALFGLPYEMPRVQVDEWIEEGHPLALAGAWDVWHVPGHAPGHVLLRHGDTDLVLGGDLLFQGGYGRVDLPGADAGVMAASLRRALEQLPPKSRILPGHGPETTMAAEAHWLERLLAGAPASLG